MPRTSNTLKEKREYILSACKKRKSEASEKLESVRQTWAAGASSDAGMSGNLLDSITRDVNALPDEMKVRTTLQIRQSLIESLDIGKEENKEKKEESDTISLMPNTVFTAVFEKYGGPCPSCYCKLNIKCFQKSGNSVVKVKCSQCDFSDDFHPKALGEGEEFNQPNMNLVYETLEDGRLYTGYKKVCASLGIDQSVVILIIE